MTTRFSTGEVDKPTHAAIVKGFHKYTSAAISPEESKSKKKIKFKLHQPVRSREYTLFLNKFYQECICITRNQKEEEEERKEKIKKQYKKSESKCYV
jgi:hypothetical protein